MSFFFRLTVPAKVIIIHIATAIELEQGARAKYLLLL